MSDKVRFWVVLAFLATLTVITLLVQRGNESKDDDEYPNRVETAYHMEVNNDYRQS